MPKVSVIIAAYNASKYLPECLDSMSRQTLSDIEVLCVDDASTDNTLDILNEYASQDVRFRVFHQETNSGPCVARNVALKHSRGEYVCFLDSDDWMDSDTLERAVEVFSMNPQTDIVLFRCMYAYEDGRREEYPMQSFDVKSGEEAFMDSLTWKIHGIYMIRGDLHREMPYDDSPNAYNDENVSRMHFVRSREVRCTGGTYYYRMHSGSVTHKTGVDFFKYLKTCEDMKQQLLDMNMKDGVINAYECQRWLVFIDRYMHYFKYKEGFCDAEKKQILSELKRVWKGIEVQRLDSRLMHKFGYMPLHGSWNLFRLQETIYFSLRKMMRKL